MLHCQKATKFQRHKSSSQWLHSQSKFQLHSCCSCLRTEWHTFHLYTKCRNCFLLPRQFQLDTPHKK